MSLELRHRTEVAKFAQSLDTGVVLVSGPWSGCAVSGCLEVAAVDIRENAPRPLLEMMTKMRRVRVLGPAVLNGRLAACSIGA
jgi:hypothetical protein